MAKTNIFKILSDQQRRDILTMLKDERMNAGEIAEALGISPAALSYHLKLLKEADLVFEEKEKNFIYYSLNASVIEEVMLWLADLKGDGKNGQN